MMFYLHMAFGLIDMSFRVYSIIYHVRKTRGQTGGETNKETEFLFLH